MKLEGLQYYKPSGKAWLAVSILGLCVTAIVFIVASSDINVEVGTSLNLKVKTGEAAPAINVYNIQPQKKFGI